MENLTGGNPPVRPLPCVVPCKLYFTMDQITHTVRYSMWKDILLQCQNRPDGMSAKQWLKENQVSEKSYYYWQRKFRNELFEKQGIALPALQSSSNCTDISFAEMTIPTVRMAVDDQHSEIIRASAVIKTGALTIAVSNDISDTLLSKILQEICHA